jgi:hypothetical protein
MVYNKKTPPRWLSIPAGLIVGGERVKASEVFYVYEEQSLAP